MSCQSKITTNQCTYRLITNKDGHKLLIYKIANPHSNNDSIIIERKCIKKRMYSFKMKNPHRNKHLYMA